MEAAEKPQLNWKRYKRGQEIGKHGAFAFVKAFAIRHRLTIKAYAYQGDLLNVAMKLTKRSSAAAKTTRFDETEREYQAIFNVKIHFTR